MSVVALKSQGTQPCPRSSPETRNRFRHPFLDADPASLAPLHELVGAGIAVNDKLDCKSGRACAKDKLCEIRAAYFCFGEKWIKRVCIGTS